MDVVRVVLGVVVFDQERPALHPVVVALAALLSAHPGEADLVQAGAPDRLQALFGEGAGLGVGVLPDEGEEDPLLVGVQLTVGDAAVLLNGGLPLRAGDDVRRGGGAEHGLRLLLRGEGLEQRAGEVLLGAQHAGADGGSVRHGGAHLGRVRSEELRGAGDGAALHHGPVQGAVVSLVAPAPGAALLRRAEDAEEVELRVPHRAAAHLLRPEDLLQVPDRAGLFEAALAEPGAQQGERGLALRRVHLLEGETFSLARDEVPVQALGVVESEGGAAFLLRREGGEERAGRGGHGSLGTGALRGDGGCGEGQHRNGSQNRSDHFRALLSASRRRPGLRPTQGCSAASHRFPPWHLCCAAPPRFLLGRGEGLGGGPDG